MAAAEMTMVRRQDVVAIDCNFTIYLLLFLFFVIKINLWATKIDWFKLLRSFDKLTIPSRVKVPSE